MFEAERPKIVYPCHWEYRLIGEGEPAMRAAVERVLSGRSRVVEPSRESRGGRYLSLRLEVEVRDEVDRLEIFAALRDEPAIRWIL